MALLLGTTPQYGIPKQEDGLLLDSLEFSWVPEWLDQKNNVGRVCGRILVDEHMTASVSGAVALSDDSTVLKGGAAFAFINSVPNLFSGGEVAFSNHISDISYSYSNTDVVKANFTVSIYDFGRTY